MYFDSTRFSRFSQCIFASAPRALSSPLIIRSVHGTGHKECFTFCPGCSVMHKVCDNTSLPRREINTRCRRQRHSHHGDPSQSHQHGHKPDQQQMYRIKGIEEIFHLHPPLAIIESNGNKCKRRCHLPQKGDAARCDLQGFLFTENI